MLSAFEPAATSAGWLTGPVRLPLAAPPVTIIMVYTLLTPTHPDYLWSIQSAVGQGLRYGIGSHRLVLWRDEPSGSATIVAGAFRRATRVPYAAGGARQ